ncbi:MAG TPA: glycosyltransferase family 39 protein [Anaerolineales bacterium]|nr:glycosyltransferase family 39 protein [Anaerolineales bacterium]
MSPRQRCVLFAILAISVLLRLGVALYLGNQVEAMPGTFDQISYHTLALRLLGGHGFTFDKQWWPMTAAGSPTAHWSYLYTVYLAGVYTLFGKNPLAARLIQALIAGLLQPFLAYLVGRQVFGAAAGLAAAALTAVYTYFFYYAANLMTESFYITAILGGLYFAIQLGRSPGTDLAANPRDLKVKQSVSLGLCLGAAILLRQLFLLFIPFLFAWVLSTDGRRRLGSVVIAGSIIAVIIAPITVYNYTRFQRFVLLNTNAGYAFFWGNHPIYGTHFIPILPSSTYQKLIPQDLRGLDEAALDQALLSRAVSFVLEDPQRYVLLSISRIPPYFMFWPSAESGVISNLARVSSFGILWPLMLYGLWLSFARRGAGFLSQPASLLFLFIVIYTLIHLLTWTLIRYRLPVDAILIVFSGLAVVDLLPRVRLFRKLVEVIA